MNMSKVHFFKNLGTYFTKPIDPKKCKKLLERVVALFWIHWFCQVAMFFKKIDF